MAYKSGLLTTYKSWDDPPSVSLESQNLPQRHQKFPRKRRPYLGDDFQGQWGGIQHRLSRHPVFHVLLPPKWLRSALHWSVAKIQLPRDSPGPNAEKPSVFHVVVSPRWRRGWVPHIQGPYTWNPNDPCFDWKRPCFGGLTFKNRGQLGSRYIDTILYLLLELIGISVTWGEL